MSNKKKNGFQADSAVEHGFQVPPEILKFILQFLENNDLGEAMLVCRIWNELGEELWKCTEVMISGPEDVEVLAWNRMKRVNSIVLNSPIALKPATFTSVLATLSKLKRLVIHSLTISRASNSQIFRNRLPFDWSKVQPVYSRNMKTQSEVAKGKQIDSNVKLKDPNFQQQQTLESP